MEHYFCRERKIWNAREDLSLRARGTMRYWLLRLDAKQPKHCYLFKSLDWSYFTVPKKTRKDVYT